jgi:hypothetical protein
MYTVIHYVTAALITEDVYKIRVIRRRSHPPTVKSHVEHSYVASVVDTVPVNNP